MSGLLRIQGNHLSVVRPQSYRDCGQASVEIPLRAFWERKSGQYIIRDQYRRRSHVFAG